MRGEIKELGTCSLCHSLAFNHCLLRKNSFIIHYITEDKHKCLTLYSEVPPPNSCALFHFKIVRKWIQVDSWHFQQCHCLAVLPLPRFHGIFYEKANLDESCMQLLDQQWGICGPPNAIGLYIGLLLSLFLLAAFILLIDIVLFSNFCFNVFV